MTDHHGPEIVVLGGGTAGWMAACLFAKAWPAARVTLVESPDVAIVGVGEGSTPHLRTLFGTLGIAEDAWMTVANATYKTGIRFVGWGGPDTPSYFHPFPSAIDLHTEPAFHSAALARRTGMAVDANPDRFFLNTLLAERCLAPVAPRNFPFEIGYGYHFDARLIGEVLRRDALARGVVHRTGHVDHVEVDAAGDVAALRLTGGEKLSGDLFIDSTGFRAVIASGALGVRHRSYGEVLFNDRAVVIATPTEETGPEPYTTATALCAGWAWRIPLTNRIGNGYVYSSQFAEPDAAERTLRAHLGVSSAATARHLMMRVGRLETSWTGNCLAIGLAQGFLEPLEATALHLTQTTIEAFIDAWRNGDGTLRHRDMFNAAIARRWDGIRDYIACHYRMNRRQDTPYWRACAAIDPPSEALKAVITAWFTGSDLEHAVISNGLAGYYPPMSWGCLFAGYGQFPHAAKLSLPDHPERWAAPEQFLERCASNFTSHSDQLRRYSDRITPHLPPNERTSRLRIAAAASLSAGSSTPRASAGKCPTGSLVPEKA